MTLRISEKNPNFVLIVRELTVQPATCLELERIIGIDHRNIANHIKFGRAAKLIRIETWEPRVKGGRPVYGLMGDHKKDAPRPKRMTSAEEMRHWRKLHPEQDNKSKIKHARNRQQLLGGIRYRGNCGSSDYRPKL